VTGIDRERHVPRVLSRVAEALRHERSAGLAVTVGAVAAVVWSFADYASYHRIINGSWGVALLEQHSLDSLHDFTVNGLMVLFFLVVGLELSEELRVGHLRDRRGAALPIAAAVGGMAATAGIFVLLGLFWHNDLIVRAWAVPTATDVAFVLGALALVGPRVPTHLRVFLLTLAVADDVLAVAILALAYQHHSDPVWLLGAAVVVGVLILVRRPLPQLAYWAALVAVWLCFTMARIEPALAGVVVGLLVPFETMSTGARMDRATAPWSNGVALPMFALAACGLPWHDLSFGTHARQIAVGVVVARIVGKTVGISGTVAIGGRFGLRRPPLVSLKVVMAASVLCAVGFTVPLLFAESVYGFDTVNYDAATLGMLVASVIAGAIGFAAMRAVTRRTRA
jgi:NhaA family Na+:H+ antiporter